MYNALLEILRDSSLLESPQIVDFRSYGQEAFRVKIRAQVTPQLTFQVWLNHNPRRTRYAYQLFDPDGPLLRWDNAPHYPDLEVNVPHHHHTLQGRVVVSQLQGDPLQDLPIVLAEIEKRIANGE